MFKKYVGQTGRNFLMRCEEHIQDIKITEKARDSPVTT
jgi:hypothetical protein